MVEIAKKLREEKGQGLVEAVITLPLLLIAVFMVIQFGWTLFTASSLNYACTHAGYVITAEEASAGNADELVKAKLVEASPWLASGTLTVSNATVTTLPTEIESKRLSTSDIKNYRITTKNEKTVRVMVSADVEYQPVTLFGVSDPMKYTRHIESSKITAETFELA